MSSRQIFTPGDYVITLSVNDPEEPDSYRLIEADGTQIELLPQLQKLSSPSLSSLKKAIAAVLYTRKEEEEREEDED